MKVKGMLFRACLGLARCCMRLDSMKAADDKGQRQGGNESGWEFDEELAKPLAFGMKALELLPDPESESVNAIELFSTLGDIFLQQKEPDAALHYFHMALNAQKHDDEKITGKIAECYELKQEQKLADIEMAERMLKLSAK